MLPRSAVKTVNLCNRIYIFPQVLSNSVVHGLKFYSDQHYAGFSGCGETMEFCKRMNDMFDALNRKMPNQGLTPNSGDFKVCIVWSLCLY